MTGYLPLQAYPLKDLFLKVVERIKALSVILVTQ
jgi:hypothetical protein